MSIPLIEGIGMADYFTGGTGISNALVERNRLCKYPIATCNPVDCASVPHIVDASNLMNKKGIVDLSKCPPNCYFQVNLENTIPGKTYIYSILGGSVITEGTEHFPYKSAGADVHQKFKITSGFNTQIELSEMV